MQIVQFSTCTCCLLYLMHTGHAIDTMKQLQSPCIVQPQVDVHPQSLTFSKDMSNDHLAQWLRNHPSMTGTNYKEDISKLIGTLHDNVI